MAASSELLFYQPETVSNASSNGGRLTATEIPTSVKNNVWPDVPHAEQETGSTKYRKIFYKFSNDDDIALASPRVFVENPSPGGDRVLIFPGTQTDTQGDLTGSERLYGTGALDLDVSAGASSVDVLVEDAADAVFQDGDLIRISDMADISDAGGAEEFIRLAATGAVSWNGNKATLVFESGVTLSNAYSAALTRVGSVIESADIQGGWDSWGGSTAAGTYDGETPPTAPTTNVPLLDSIGSIEQTWTITFTTATAFTCSGDTVGSVSGGSISTDFAPNNSDFSKPYFTLPFAGWGGTWAPGDILTFTTHPAAVGIWWKRVIPAGAGSLSANRVFVAITGEAA
ncbi:MAG: hypothetical protein HQL52_17475 [Magnetococcales bacterium]|nr:hypothetical protein [Magnetococcales bacterium]